MKTKPRNKAEQARFDKMKEQGICMACYQLGIKGEQYIEIHHLLSGNKRIGHMATVSLCVWHHRGVLIAGDNVPDILIGLIQRGPSLAHGSKPFRAQFGTDKELLDMQNGFLND